MLIRLVILAALVSWIVYPARPQIPRNRGQQNRPTQKEADKPQLTQPAPPALQVQLAPAEQKHDTDQKPSSYPWEELLSPTNIPNWALCLVGGFAGWAAFKTLRAIKRQADTMDQQAGDARISGAEAAKMAQSTLDALKQQAGHMERQTKILEDSVAAAQRSADAALAQVEAAKSTQRAQLRIEFAEPQLTFDEELGGYPIRYQVILDGTTRAYVIHESIFAYMGRTAREKRSISKQLHIPKDFTPEMSPYQDYTLIHTNTDWPEVDTGPDKVEMVHKKNFTVFVDGQIMYQDIFGDVWQLQFDRVWTPNSRHWGEDATGGNWCPFGSGRYDTHRKVDHPKQDQSQKPN